MGAPNDKELMLYEDIADNMLYEGNVQKFVSRASTSTYIDDGVLKYADVDEARFQDGVLLLEGESENLCIESLNIEGWNVSSRSKTIGHIESIDEQNNASILVASNEDNNTSLYVYKAYLYFKDGYTYTQSAIIDVSLIDDSQIISIYSHQAIFGNFSWVGINGNGEIFTSGNPLSYNVNKIKDNIYKLSITNISQINGGSNYGVLFWTRGGSFTTTEGPILQFPQLEEGLHSTSFIPTMATEETRAPDISENEEMGFNNFHPSKASLLPFLPNYYEKISSAWVDLAQAFQETTYGWIEETEIFRDGYVFHKANSEQLAHLEELFKIPNGNNLPNGYRVGRLRAKILPKSTTIKSIKEIAKTFYPNETNPTIDELGADYTITITFKNMKLIPLDMNIFNKTIVDILQADLDFIINIDVSMSAFTHDDLVLQIHDNLAAYRQDG